MSEASLFKKLRLHTVNRALLLFPPQGFLEKLGKIPDSLVLSLEAKGKYDFVMVFVANRKEYLARIEQAVTAVEYDRMFWLGYPKLGASLAADLSRDVVWELMKPTGLRPVTQIAIDETWSGLRFRPVEMVNKSKQR